MSVLVSSYPAMPEQLLAQIRDEARKLLSDSFTEAAIEAINEGMYYAPRDARLAAALLANDPKDFEEENNLRKLIGRAREVIEQYASGFELLLEELREAETG